MRRRAAPGRAREVTRWAAGRSGHHDGARGVRGEGELTVAGRVRGVPASPGHAHRGGRRGRGRRRGRLRGGGRAPLGSVTAHDKLRVLPGGVVDARVRAARLAMSGGHLPRRDAGPARGQRPLGRRHPAPPPRGPRRRRATGSRPPRHPRRLRPGDPADPDIQKSPHRARRWPRCRSPARRRRVPRDHHPPPPQCPRRRRDVAPPPPTSGRSPPPPRPVMKNAAARLFRPPCASPDVSAAPCPATNARPTARPSAHANALQAHARPRRPPRPFAAPPPKGLRQAAAAVAPAGRRPPRPAPRPQRVAEDARHSRGARRRWPAAGRLVKRARRAPRAAASRRLQRGPLPPASGRERFLHRLQARDAHGRGPPAHRFGALRRGGGDGDVAASRASRSWCPLVSAVSLTSALRGSALRRSTYPQGGEGTTAPAAASRVKRPGGRRGGAPRRRSRRAAARGRRWRAPPRGRAGASPVLALVDREEGRRRRARRARPSPRAGCSTARTSFAEASPARELLPAARPSSL